MTMTQKILAAPAGLSEVRAGQLIECQLDLALGNDITAPLAINEFERMGAQTVFDPDRIALVPDHFVPNKDIASATQARQMRLFAQKHNITNYFDPVSKFQSPGTNNPANFQLYLFFQRTRRYIYHYVILAYSPAFCIYCSFPGINW